MPTRTLTFTFDDELAAQAFDRAVKSSSGDLPYGVRYPAHDETITDEHVDMVLAIEYFASRSVNAWLPIVAPNTPHEDVSPGCGLEIVRSTGS